MSKGLLEGTLMVGLIRVEGDRIVVEMGGKREELKSGTKRLVFPFSFPERPISGLL